MTDYLADTHTFLWALFSKDRLTVQAREILEDENVIVYVSAISFWEISLKHSIGKLEIAPFTAQELLEVGEQSGFVLTGLSPLEAATFYRLPRLAHRDPFDRMLIWQAIRQKLTLISRDAAFADYRRHGLKVVW
uniref:PIN domain nuclease, a component of toxin-antitoxin system (PIN domain) n=1 Tax=Candidatus Kentrum sp. FM TaxID=2126340 RepID=A0A450S6P7_9GAMM|nr:MAG: PIN domain nuclease, a component of toxin-antitoxin system (PIN domain) [Candidatus Kentron sp. FM]VFJ55896.1 MAG: PIN domain nuclease, a component of toxin-antitoxin system (PIN domain) [Candidatus Kentron sp. FM]VFK10689.1 MAG: PIN domain nuclease, a component of toxin-antitoxin system (PIN domain) [Candidatus Kentron sp. FM]